jgi:hypothetical protein
MPSSTSPLTPL